MDKMKIIREFAQNLRNLEVTQREVWQETEQVFSSLYDVRLFTVLYYDHKNNMLLRLSSSNETINAVGGKKYVTRSKWSDTVLRQGEIFIAPDKTALMDVFADAPFLISYGCESVLNIPVRFQNKVIGSVNMLHKEHCYDQVDLAPAQIIVQMLVPYILDVGFKACRSEMPGVVTAKV